MNLIGIKHLIGGKVSLNPEFLTSLQNKPPEGIGTIVGINVLDVDNFDAGVEYTVKMGEWILEGVREENLIKE